MVSAALRPAAVDVRITEMRARHLRGVMAIEEAVYPRPWSSQLFVAELERRSDRCYLVALAPSSDRWRRRRVVGYAGAMIVPGHTDRDAHVTTLATDPSEHRRKIGTRLLLHLLREVLARGAEAATLEVRTTNPGAQRLYRGFGFAPVGVRPGYYSETGEDAVIMWAHDIQKDAFAARLDDQQARLDEPGGASGAPDEVVPWVKGRVGLRREQPAGTPEEGET
jgi:[ribosomal protein S18]-alanine N-acetyltransferase